MPEYYASLFMNDLETLQHSHQACPELHMEGLKFFHFLIKTKPLVYNNTDLELLSKLQGTKPYDECRQLFCILKN